MPNEKKKPGPKSSADKKTELLAEARKRFAAAIGADNHNRTLAETILKFTYIPGEQWDQDAKEKRKDRLCLEFNQLHTFIGQVVGDQRKNKHNIKISAGDDQADPKTAEVIANFIRAIERKSHADIAYDNGREHAADAGFGYWRIITKYEDDDSFNQVIRIEPIYNRFSVAFGPSEAWDRSDAEYCFVFSTHPKEKLKKYGVEYPTDFDEYSSEERTAWFSEDTVTLAEYFKKEYFTKKIYQLPDGIVVDELPDKIIWLDTKTNKLQKKPKSDWPQLLKDKLVKEREVKSYKIIRYLLSGNAILEDDEEDAKEWPSKYWPIVPVDGKTVNINGKTYRRGVNHYALDGQKLHNYYLTTDAETVAFAPKQPYVIADEQVGPFKSHWDNAHAVVYPYLPYKHVDNVPPPQRQQGPQISSALVQGANYTRDEMRMATGITSISAMDRTEEKSGIAIARRKAIGDTGTFSYTDNADRSLELTANIILDLIPKIIDTERDIPQIDIQGNESTVRVNTVVRDQKNLEDKMVHDLTKGKYNVSVSVGPSYDTQREEGAAAIHDLMKILATAYPQAVGAIAHRFTKLNDWYGAQEISDTLMKVAPKETLTKEELEKIAEDQPQQPPQGPPPQLMIEIEKLHLAHKEQARKEFETQAKAIADLMKAEAAELGSQVAQFTQVAEQLRGLVEMQTQREQAAQGAQGTPQGQPMPGPRGQGSMPQ